MASEGKETALNRSLVYYDADGDLSYFNDEAGKYVYVGNIREQLSATGLLILDAAGEMLNAEGGANFAATQFILRHYLVWQESLNAKENFVEELEESKNARQKTRGMKLFVDSDTTEKEIMDLIALLKDVEPASYKTHLRKEKSRNLAYFCLDNIDRAVYFYKNCGKKAEIKAMEEIEALYLKKEYQNYNQEELIEIFDITKPTFIKLKRQGISLIASFLFGDFPEDQAFMKTIFFGAK